MLEKFRAKVLKVLNHNDKQNAAELTSSGLSL